MVVVTRAGKFSQSAQSAQMKGVKLVMEWNFAGVIKSILPSFRAFSEFDGDGEPPPLPSSSGNKRRKVELDIRPLAELKKRALIPIANTLSDKKVFVTGNLKLFKTYSEITKFINECGGVRVRNVTQYVSLLIKGDISPSNYAINRAKYFPLSIKIVTEEEFLDIIQDRGCRLARTRNITPHQRSTPIIDGERRRRRNSSEENNASRPIPSSSLSSSSMAHYLESENDDITPISSIAVPSRRRSRSRSRLSYEGAVGKVVLASSAAADKENVSNDVGRFAEEMAKNLTKSGTFRLTVDKMETLNKIMSRSFSDLIEPIELKEEIIIVTDTSDEEEVKERVKNGDELILKIQGGVKIQADVEVHQEQGGTDHPHPHHHQSSQVEQIITTNGGGKVQDEEETKRREDTIADTGGQAEQDITAVAAENVMEAVVEENREEKEDALREIHSEIKILADVMVDDEPNVGNIDEDVEEEMKGREETTEKNGQDKQDFTAAAENVMEVDDVEKGEAEKPNRLIEIEVQEQAGDVTADQQQRRQQQVMEQLLIVTHGGKVDDDHVDEEETNKGRREDEMTEKGDGHAEQDITAPTAAAAQNVTVNATSDELQQVLEEEKEKEGELLLIRVQSEMEEIQADVQVDDERAGGATTADQQQLVVVMEQIMEGGGQTTEAGGQGDEQDITATAAATTENVMEVDDVEERQENKPDELIEIIEEQAGGVTANQQQLVVVLEQTITNGGGKVDDGDEEEMEGRNEEATAETSAPERADATENIVVEVVPSEEAGEEKEWEFIEIQLSEIEIQAEIEIEGDVEVQQQAGGISDQQHQHHQVMEQTNNNKWRKSRRGCR